MGHDQPAGSDFAHRVRQSFAAQSFMTLLGARLARVAAGEVEIAVDRRPDLCQQHGFIHAGVTAAVADSAAGYAALSLFGDDQEVLTSEFKINLLRPAAGDRLIARGRALKPGRTLTICAADVVSVDQGREVHVATALLTMVAVAVGRA